MTWTITDKNGPIWSATCHCGYRASFPRQLLEARPPKCRRCSGTMAGPAAGAGRPTPQIVSPPAPIPIATAKRYRERVETPPGAVFGRLTITGPGPTIDKAATLLARCQCGKMGHYRRESITTGRTRSCGCIRLELLEAQRRAATVALPGDRYGALTVLAESAPYIGPSDQKPYRRVLCVCECGRERVVLVRRLADGKATRCQYCPMTSDLHGPAGRDKLQA
jgi:hypothetical protein